MRGLRRGQVGLDPQTIARGEVWNLRYRQGFCAARDGHVEVWAGEVKGRRISGCSNRKRKHGGKEERTRLNQHGDSLSPLHGLDGEMRHVIKNVSRSSRMCRRRSADKVERQHGS